MRLIHNPQLLKWWNAAKTLLFSAVDLYIIGLALFIIIKLLFGEQLKVIAFGNSFLHLFLLTALLWFPITLARRRWKIAIVAALPVWFFVGSYGVLFIPRTAAAPIDSPRITVMTYNIHGEEQFLTPMLEVIQASNADVVAIQELSLEAADALATEFGNLYPYHAFHSSADNSVIGQGVMSRYPIIEDAYWRNDDLPEHLAHQRVEIDLQGTAVVLYNAHPIHPIMKSGQFFNVNLRTQEIQSVLNRANLDEGAVLIVGDFNMSDQSDDYGHITSVYSDAYREAGWGMGFTFPDFSAVNATPFDLVALPIRPIVRLDYIFHNRAMVTLSAQVWHTSGGSDHRPVIAELAVENRE